MKAFGWILTAIVVMVGCIVLFPLFIVALPFMLIIVAVLLQIAAYAVPLVLVVWLVYILIKMKR